MNRQRSKSSKLATGLEGHRRTLFTTLAGLVALVLTGCGTAVEPGSYRTGPRDLVLQLVDIPGTVQPGEPTSIVPTFSMYGDGRVIVATPGRFEGALPELRELQLSRERTDQLVRAALDASVQDNRKDDIEISPDAPTSLLSLNAEGRSGTSQLGPTAGGGIGDLRNSLRAYAKAKALNVYNHDGIAVIATEAGAGGGATTKSWGFSEIQPAAEKKIDGSFCTVYRRTSLDGVTTAARTSTASTLWFSGDKTYVIKFRPMLPHESDCASLQRTTRSPR